jgi:hypothetical protein
MSSLPGTIAMFVLCGCDTCVPIMKECFLSGIKTVDGVFFTYNPKR